MIQLQKKAAEEAERKRREAEAAKKKKKKKGGGRKGREKNRQSSRGGQSIVDTSAMIGSMTNMSFGQKKQKKLLSPSDVSSEPDTSDFEDDGEEILFDLEKLFIDADLSVKEKSCVNVNSLGLWREIGRLALSEGEIEIKEIWFYVYYYRTHIAIRGKVPDEVIEKFLSSLA